MLNKILINLVEILLVLKSDFLGKSSRQPTPQNVIKKIFFLFVYFFWQRRFFPQKNEFIS